MKEFKGTKGKWEVMEHSWSDTSIMANGEGSSICQTSIYDDATEENQEELEDIVSANFRLIACAPEMLEMLIKMQVAFCELDNLQEGWEEEREELDKLISKALGE